MPRYDLNCGCGYTIERILGMSESYPDCPACGKQLQRVYSAPPMIKMKGEGGYPARRKQVFNTTKTNHPKLEFQPNRRYF